MSRVDAAFRVAERRFPVGIRALIRGYAAWLELARRSSDAVSMGGVALRVEPGVALPIRRTHDALVAGVRDRRVVDVGCGSGYLGLMAALEGAAHVLLVDRDQTAVENAAANAKRLQVDDRVSIRRSDLLTSVQTDAEVLISDPPWFLEELGDRHRWTSDPGFIPRLLFQASETMVQEMRLVIPRFALDRIERLAGPFGWVPTASLPITRGGARRRQIRFLDFLPIVAVRLRRTPAIDRNEAAG